MRNLRSIAWVSALALALVIGGCGQADQTGSLTVASVPKAEVYVDGTSYGESGQTLSLPAGEHKVELRLEKFISHEETLRVTAGTTVSRDVTLAAKDPSDPTVIAKLAECEGVDMAPFVAPETHRGSRGKRSVAVLLWPARDVRKNGLVNYAIEADETYGGDASLEFRHGRTVIYREAFNPETVTTVRAIPAEVLEHVKVGRTITWGLYFEDSRRAIKTQFKVVQRPKAERQLERLRTSRHMQRQPEITQAIMSATALENSRLYAEALVANLRIAADHPNSTQPYRGIITTLRRLGAEHSELFSFVSPHVSGKGGHARVDRPGVNARGSHGLGISAWSPIQEGAVPTVEAPKADGATAPSTGGVTPTPEATEPTPGADGNMAGQREDQVNQMRTEIERIAAEQQGIADEATAAQTAAMHADKSSADADKLAQAAEAAAREAREAVENADEPTREQQEKMYQSGMKAEEAREAANNARQEAEMANEKARALEAQADALKQNLQAMQQSLDLALGAKPDHPGATLPHENAPQNEAEGKAALAEASKRASDAQTAWEQAKAQLEAAEKAFSADPSATNQANVENASRAVGSAAKYAHETDQALEAVKRSLETIGNQVQKPVVK